jgi:hypothetical protein
LMSERAGRGRRATAAQCAEVRRLSCEGVPIRRIASQVFGDAGFRGRVERILRAPAATACAPAFDLPVAAAVTAETVPTVRLALSRYLVRVERGEIQPTLGDLVRLLDLERRLQAFELVEQMNALTRAIDEPEGSDG